MQNQKNRTVGAELSLVEKLRLFLIVLVLAYVPLIMRAHLYDAKLASYPWFAESSFEIDIFLYHKGIALISISCLMLAVLTFEIYRNRERLKGQYWLYPLFGYAFLAILSTILSPFKSFGLSGFYEQHESLWILLAYCVVCFYSYFFVNSEKAVRYIIGALLVLAILTAVIGLTQLFGVDFFESDLGKMIIIPGAMEEEFGFRQNLAFKFSGSGNHQVYLTMYNPNYVGMFSALVFPIFLSLGFSAKKISKKALWSILALIHFILAMGSGSKTFLGSFFVSGLLAFVLFRKKLRGGMKLVVGFVALLVILTAGYFTYIQTNPISYVANALNTKKNENRIGGLQFFTDHVAFTYNGETLLLSLKKEGKREERVVIKDAEGVDLPQTTAENEDQKVEKEAFQSVTFGMYQYDTAEGTKDILLITTPEGMLRVADNGERYIFLTSALKQDEIVDAPSAVLKDHDAFASGRGYIWSRTFPVLAKHLFLGSGADSFSLVFPQNDYIGKMNGGFGEMMISKPHNIFMQIGVQTGVLSLICYLALALIFLWKAIRFYAETEKESETKVFGAALVLGIVGYLISGLFNDSIVAVAPLYWCLLGVGYGVLSLNKREA